MKSYFRFAAACGVVAITLFTLAGCGKDQSQPAKQTSQTQTGEKPAASESTPATPERETVAREEKTANAGGAASAKPSYSKTTENQSAVAAKKSIPASKISASKSASAKATMPKVGLSEKLKATCRVKVGDVMPNAELADQTGSKKPLKSLMGPNASVIIFWETENEPFTQRLIESALNDLQIDVADAFADRGVAVVGIHVGGTSDAMKNGSKKAGATFTQLHDADKTFFSTVAVERLPRVYLVDGSGKILWFDTEYARGTRLAMQQALAAALTGK